MSFDKSLRNSRSVEILIKVREIRCPQNELSNTYHLNDFCIDVDSFNYNFFH